MVHDTTQAQPKHDLTISVKSGNNACNVWVLGTASSHYFDKTGADRGSSPPPATPIAKNSSVLFEGLLDGSYTVYANAGGYNQVTNKIYGVSVNGGNVTLSNVTP